MAALVRTPADDTRLVGYGRDDTVAARRDEVRVWVLSPCAASGRAHTGERYSGKRRLPAARRRITSRLMPFLRRRPGFLSHVRYRFVDCRWSMTDAELGRREYLESHIPGAVFVDVERELSAPPGALGRHPLPPRPRSPSAMSRAGIEAGVFVVAYGSLGGAERLWWLLRHFGHDDCAVLDLGGVARAAARRRGDGRAGDVRRGARPATRSSWRSLRSSGMRSSSSTHASPSAGAESRTTSTACRAASPER